MRFIDKKTIQIDRELSDLDKFVIEFTQILKKYTNYVIVSGYVAILLGRSRASEDVDVLISKIDFPTFKELYDELKRKKFYCLNVEEGEVAYSYLEDGLAIRFAKIDTVIPNIELKWEKNKFDRISLKEAIKANIKNHVIPISSLELQIAFKENVLRSPKDIEDADHMKVVAKEYIDTQLIKKYKRMLHEFYFGEQ